MLCEQRGRSLGDFCAGKAEFVECDLIASTFGKGVLQPDQFGRHGVVLQGPRSDFVAETVAFLMVFRDDEGLSLLQGFGQRRLVPRLQRVKIDDFGIDALLGQFAIAELGGLRPAGQCTEGFGRLRGMSVGA